MKNLWIALCIGLIFVIEGCDLLGGGDTIIVPSQSLEIVQAVAIPETVEYDGNTIIYYEVKNAEIVMINNIKMPNNKGSYEIKNLTPQTLVKITASGEGSTTSQNVIIKINNALPPKVTVTAPLGVIPYGDKATFSWTTEGAFSSVSVDGVTQLSNSFTTPALFKSTEYAIAITGPGGITTQKVTIPVGDWTTSSIGILNHDKFILKSLTYKINGVVADSISVNGVGERIFYFNKEGKMISFDNFGKNKNSWDYSLGESFITINGSPYKIVKLIEKEFIYTTETSYNGKPALFEYSYFRP